MLGAIDRSYALIDQEWSTVHADMMYMQYIQNLMQMTNRLWAMV